MRSRRCDRPAQARGQRESEIAPDRQVRKEQVVLELQPQAPLLGRDVGQVVLADEDAAGDAEGGVHRAREPGEQRRLAAAGGTHDGHAFARRDVEVERCEQRARAERDAHAAQVQRVVHASLARPRRRPITTAGTASASR